jgi:hypothetical protein
LAVFLHRPFLARTTLALALWFGAIVGVYACYEVSREVWWCLRFILPAIPALILAGLRGLTAISHSWTAPRQSRFYLLTAVLLLAWAVGSSTYWTKRLGVLYTRDYEQTYAEAGQAARASLPENSLVVCHATSGALFASTEFALLRWDQIDAAQFARFAALAKQAGRPICAVIFDSEETAALHERCPGEWTRVGTVKNLGLWRLVAAAPPSPK